MITHTIITVCRYRVFHFFTRTYRRHGLACEGLQLRIPLAWAPKLTHLRAVILLEPSSALSKNTDQSLISSRRCPRFVHGINEVMR